MMDNIQEYYKNDADSTNCSELPKEGVVNNGGKKYFERLRDALSVRAKNILLDNGIYYYDDFLSFISSDNNQFINFRNCGKKTVKELDELSLLLLRYVKDPSSIVNTPIEELGFSARTLTSLKNAHIETLGELVSFEKATICKFHGLGRKTLQEIERAVISKGLWLGFNLNTIDQEVDIKPQIIPNGDTTKSSDATKEDQQDVIVDTSILNVLIEDLGLSVRSFNCLESAGIETLGDLVAFEKEDLFKFRNLGRKSIQEIEEIVISKGLWFGLDTRKYRKEKAIKQHALESLFSNIPVLKNLSKTDLDYSLAFKEKFSHFPMAFLLYKSLRCLTEHEQEVVKRAWGIKKCNIQSLNKTLPVFSEWSVELSPPLLLDEIAFEIGLTRERTRQIYEKANRRIISGALKNIVQHKDWDEYGIGKDNPVLFPDDLNYDCIINERGFLIEYIQKNMDSEWLGQFIKDVPCISANFLYYINLLHGMTPYWIDKEKKLLSTHYITTGLVTPFFFVNNHLEQYSYNKAIKEVLRLQKAKKTDSVLVPINSYFIDNKNYWSGNIRLTAIETNAILRLLIWIFQTLCGAQIENDCILFKANIVNYSDKIYEILKTAGVRLHRDEIFNQLQISCMDMGLSCKFKNSSQITPLLTREPRIIPFGRSSYWGLKEWGELIGSIREIALEIVSISDEPIHIDDLAKRVMESRPDSNEKSVSSIIRQTTSTGELLLFYGDYIGCPNRKYEREYIIMPQTFDDWLKAFNDYVVKNKHFPYCNQDGFEGYLYRWYFKAGQLTDLSSEEILKFEMLEKALAHYPHNSTEYNFLHNCNLYKLFVEGNNRTPKKEDDSDLYMWFYITSRNYTSYKDNRNKYFSQLLQYLSDKLY